MPLGTTREKVIHGMGKARGRAHRYTYARWAVGAVFTIGIALLPALDILRFDMWSGRHMWLGEQVGFIEVAKAFAFPFLAVNVAIILASRFIGRYLCGFVCPYGALARLAEWLRWRERRGLTQLAGHGALFAVSALLAAITFSFWIDWRVFVEGSGVAVAISGSLLAGLTALIYFAVDRVGLLFCQQYCPSGVYFAVLGPDTVNGVEFAHPENCTDCHACEKVCPMDLQPRQFATEMIAEGRGFYPDEMTAKSLCIRCGDCVVACEGTTENDPGGTPLRLGFLPVDARGGDTSEDEAAAPIAADASETPESDAPQRAAS